MFVDAHTKVFSLLLDAVCELLLVHWQQLKDWLYQLMFRWEKWKLVNVVEHICILYCASQGEVMHNINKYKKTIPALEKKLPVLMGHKKTWYGRKEHPDSVQQFINHTKCYPAWDLNLQHLEAVESGMAIAWTTRLFKYFLFRISPAKFQKNM